VAELLQSLKQTISDEAINLLNVRNVYKLAFWPESDISSIKILVCFTRHIECNISRQHYCHLMNSFVAQTSYLHSVVHVLRKSLIKFD